MILSARCAAAFSSSEDVTPSNTSSPGPICPTVFPSTSTRASLTRCNTILMQCPVVAQLTSARPVLVYIRTYDRNLRLRAGRPAWKPERWLFRQDHLISDKKLPRPRLTLSQRAPGDPPFESGYAGIRKP